MCIQIYIYINKYLKTISNNALPKVHIKTTSENASCQVTSYMHVLYQVRKKTMSWSTKLTVAAIDFGTAFSGYAISFLKDKSLLDDERNLRAILPRWNSGTVQ